MDLIGKRQIRINTKIANRAEAKFGLPKVDIIEL